MEGRRQRREEVGAVFSTVAVTVDGDGEGREGERRRGLGRCSARSVAAVGKDRKPWNSMVAVTMDDDGGEGGGGGGGGGRWLRVEEVLRRAPAVEERGKGGGSGDRQGRRRGDHGSSSVDDEGEGREGERRRCLRRCSARAVAAVGEERKPWNSMVAVTMGDGGGEGGVSGGGRGRWLRAEEVLPRAPTVEKRGKGGGSDARQGRRRGDMGGGWSTGRRMATAPAATMVPATEDVNGGKDRGRRKRRGQRQGSGENGNKKERAGEAGSGFDEEAGSDERGRKTAVEALDRVDCHVGEIQITSPLF